MLKKKYTQLFLATALSTITAALLAMAITGCQSSRPRGSDDIAGPPTPVYSTDIPPSITTPDEGHTYDIRRFERRS